MSVKLRFRRMGRKKLPVFSLVAADARSPRDGRFIEDLGRYEPLAEDGAIRFNEDRILYWLGEGAQPSHTVRNLLSERGVMLRLHLLRKGKTEEEIEAAVVEFRANRAAKVPVKKSKAEIRAERLEKERAIAAEKAEEMAKKRAEREAELEKQKQAAEDAERAEHAQAAAERAQAAADVAGLKEGAEAVAEPTAEVAAEAVAEPAAEATTEAEAEVAEEPAAEEATPEAAVVEEAVEDAAPEVAEEAKEAIAEAPSVDPEPIPEPEAEAAEMVEEGAPVEAGEAVEPAAKAVAEVTEEPTAEEPAADKAPTKEETVAAEASAEPDNLTKVRGIGPKFSALLNEHSITTFSQLAGMEIEALRTIVNESGISAASANEESWPKQAGFLLAGDKDGLKAYIEELKSAK